MGFSYFNRKGFIIYLLKFLFVYAVLYYGTQLIIGLTVPGNAYSAFLHDYLDYISVLRKSLLYASKFVISIFGYESMVQNNYYLKIVDGSRVRMVYSCLGIAVFSFWAAFVIANAGNLWYKFRWIIGGIIAIWLINIARICLLIVATNDRWALFTIVDHHTMFNITAYGAVFLMMYIFDKHQKKGAISNEKQSVHER